MERARLLKLDVTTPPAEEPVSAAEAKKQLEIEASVTAHDAFIESLIESARHAVEAYSGYALVTQTIRLRYAYAGETEFRLVRPPHQSIVSIKSRYEGAETSEDLDDFFVASGLVPRLKMKTSAGAGWNATNIDEIEINHVAGYGAAADVPEPFKLAIQQTLADWFEYRNSREMGTIVSAELPGSARITLAQSGLIIQKV